MTPAQKVLYFFCRKYLSYNLAISAIGSLFIPFPWLPPPAGSIVSFAASLCTVGNIFAVIGVKRFNRDSFALSYHFGYPPKRLFRLGWIVSALAALLVIVVYMIGTRLWSIHG